MNVVRKRALSRRHLLRGFGVAIGLPWLDAMVPALSRAATKAAPTRLAFLYIPNGVIMPRWVPEGTGTDYTLSPTLAPLAALKSEINVISGLQHRNAENMGDGPGDHARASGSYLSGARPRKSATHARAGITVDQRAAEVIGFSTRLPSLELTSDRGQAAGACDSGYNCAYQATLSWRSATQPQPAEFDPRVVFERLFSDGSLSTTERAARRRADRSVLDFVREDARALANDLPAVDREKLDEYLSAVRAVERQIAHAEAHPVSPPPPGTAKPAAYPGSYADHIQVMGELMRLAFVSDTTRIATYLISREGEGKKLPELGGHEVHHEISHHQNKADKIEILSRIDLFHVSAIAKILERFSRTRDGDRSLLDRSMIVFGSGLSDGNKHLHTNLPTVIAGRGNGSVRTGRHIQLPSARPMCDLFVSLLERMGVPDERFGDSQGRLSELG